MRVTDAKVVREELVNPEPGCLYILHDTQILANGPCEFRITGTALVNGVECGTGHYKYRTNMVVEIVGMPKVPVSVVFLSANNEVHHEPSEDLTVPPPLVDPIKAQFTAWAMEMGLIEPGPDMVEESDDDEFEDDRFDIPLDTHSLVEDEDEQEEDVPADEEPEADGSDDVEPPGEAAEPAPSGDRDEEVPAQ